MSYDSLTLHHPSPRTSQLLKVRKKNSTLQNTIQHNSSGNHHHNNNNNNIYTIVGDSFIVIVISLTENCRDCRKELLLIIN